MEAIFTQIQLLSLQERLSLVQRILKQVEAETQEDIPDPDPDYLEYLDRISKERRQGERKYLSIEELPQYQAYVERKKAE